MSVAGSSGRHTLMLISSFKGETNQNFPHFTQKYPASLSVSILCFAAQTTQGYSFSYTLPFLDYVHFCFWVELNVSRTSWRVMLIDPWAVCWLRDPCICYPFDKWCRVIVVIFYITFFLCRWLSVIIHLVVSCVTYWF